MKVFVFLVFAWNYVPSTPLQSSQYEVEGILPSHNNDTILPVYLPVCLRNVPDKTVVMLRYLLIVGYPRIHPLLPMMQLPDGEIVSDPIREGW